MFRLFILSLPLLSFSCDISDIKFPEVPKHEESDAMDNEDSRGEISKPKGNKVVHIPQKKTNKQDPEKDFNSISTTITFGQPIHSFPGE